MNRSASWRDRRSAELFAPRGGRRVRRVADGLTAASDAVALVVLGLVAVPLSGIEQAVVDLIDALPGWFTVLWRLLLLIGILWCVALAVVALVHRRADVARDVVVAAALSVGIAVVSGWFVTGDGDSGFVLFEPRRNGAYPVVALAVVAAVVSTGGPHLSGPYRRAGRRLLGLVTLAVVVLQVTTPVGSAMGLLLGGLCAALVHLILGTTEGVPEPASVRASLAALGLEVEQLHPAQRQRAGVFTLQGTATDGREVLVKVYGRDARDTQALSRAWRGLWYRHSEALTLGRSQQVEREAFSILMLGSHGVAVPEVLVAGVAPNDDAILALAPSGTPLGEEVSDAEVAAMWSVLDRVHEVNLSFGDLHAGCFSRRPRPGGAHGGDGAVALGDLSDLGPRTSAADHGVDGAQLLVATVALAGRERAVRAALAHLGAEGAAGLLAFLQPAALGARARSDARSAGVKVAELRTSIAEELEVEAPAVAPLRRVSSAALARMALITLVAYAVISAVTKVDTQELLETFRNASWAWVVVALLLAQAAIAVQSVTTQGASPVRIPYGPLTLLQFAIAFVALAVPSSAARVATVIRFFQRHGVAPAAATAVSMVDSFTGFLLEVSVLLVVLVGGVGEVHLDWGNTSRSGGDVGGLLRILLVAVVVVVVAAVLALALPRVRHRIVARVRPWVSDMLGIVAGLRSPGRVARLFGGNFAAQVVFALCLGACVQAFSGHRVNLAEMLVVYIGAALFGGFMPVPGGIGVMEAALTAGLEAVGVQSAAAFGAAITFRLCTYYLPPIWGAMAFGALQRRGDL